MNFNFLSELETLSNEDEEIVFTEAVTGPAPMLFTDKFFSLKETKQYNKKVMYILTMGDMHLEDSDCAYEVKKNTKKAIIYLPFFPNGETSGIYKEMYPNICVFGATKPTSWKECKHKVCTLVRQSSLNSMMKFLNQQHVKVQQCETEMEPIFADQEPIVSPPKKQKTKGAIIPVHLRKEKKAAETEEHDFPEPTLNLIISKSVQEKMQQVCDMHQSIHSQINQKIDDAIKAISKDDKDRREISAYNTSLSDEECKCAMSNCACNEVCDVVFYQQVPKTPHEFFADNLPYAQRTQKGVEIVLGDFVVMNQIQMIKTAFVVSKPIPNVAYTNELKQTALVTFKENQMIITHKHKFLQMTGSLKLMVPAFIINESDLQTVEFTIHNFRNMIHVDREYIKNAIESFMSIIYDASQFESDNWICNAFSQPTQKQIFVMYDVFSHQFMASPVMFHSEENITRFQSIIAQCDQKDFVHSPQDLISDSMNAKVLHFVAPKTANLTFMKQVVYHLVQQKTDFKISMDTSIYCGKHKFVSMSTKIDTSYMPSRFEKFFLPPLQQETFVMIKPAGFWSTNLRIIASTIFQSNFVQATKMLFVPRLSPEMIDCLYPNVRSRIFGADWVAYLESGPCCLMKVSTVSINMVRELCIRAREISNVPWINNIIHCSDSVHEAEKNLEDFARIYNYAYFTTKYA